MPTVIATHLRSASFNHVHVSDKEMADFKSAINVFIFLTFYLSKVQSIFLSVACNQDYLLYDAYER